MLAAKNSRKRIDARSPAAATSAGSTGGFQEAALPQIFSYSVGLNSEEQRRHRIITQELQGQRQAGEARS
jgi:hypothetical protein